ncbi:DUF6114 domain-containing protein [Yinghuangia sp. YIM S09857]|uniref:DUF6114 domain-containing protein n=1 Tax=Yinghuangia sp. YIM S09857 TaxID=3436929 RepID=UPI003F53039B
MSTSKPHEPGKSEAERPRPGREKRLRGPFAQERRRIAEWRHARPFWAGFFILLGALPIIYFPYATLEVGNVSVAMSTMAGAAAAVIGCVLILMGLMVWFQPQFRMYAGVTALVCGFISFVTSNLGGFFMGLLSVTIGGSLALAWSYDDEDDEQPAEGSGGADGYGPSAADEPREDLGVFAAPDDSGAAPGGAGLGEQSAGSASSRPGGIPDTLDAASRTVSGAARFGAVAGFPAVALVAALLPMAGPSEPLPPNPFADGPCATASASASATASPTAAPTATATTGAPSTASPSPSGTPTAKATTGTPPPPSAEAKSPPSAGSPAPGTAAQAPAVAAAPTTAPAAPPVPPPAPAPTTRPPGVLGPLLDPLLDPLRQLLPPFLRPQDPAAPAVAAQSAPPTAPAAAPAAPVPPPAVPTPTATGKPPAGASATPKSAPATTPAATTPPTSAKPSTAAPSPSPTTSPSAATAMPAPTGAKPPYPCPTQVPLAANRAATGGPVLPDEPWILRSSLLAMAGMDYKGVVDVTTGSGKTKPVLKFEVSGGVDIWNLDMTSPVDGNGNRIHVFSLDNTKSYMKDGTVTFYTESLKGNLFGLIPVEFTPTSPPPLNVPVAFFTDVTVRQAGQTGATLVIPDVTMRAEKAG